MPNQITATGIQIQTVAEILEQLLYGAPGYPGMFAIYGTDINVDPNSPDGQMLNIFAQAAEDYLQFTQQAFSSMDPDQAIGVVLDQRCAINGVVRKAGTYTITPVTVTVDQAISLPGLDTFPDAPFIISDSTGNQFILEETHAFSGGGSASLSFRSAVLGVISPALNSLTQIVTVTLGVVSVNNPAAVTSTGTAEETDAQLRVRRALSVSLPAQGYFDGLYGALLGIEGVTSVELQENTTGSTDANGLEGHSIWAIVAGGDDDEIGSVIYRYRNAGCGMKGDEDVIITQADGSFFTVSFDRPTEVDLWISLDTEAVTGAQPTDEYVRQQILAGISYNINQTADGSAITAYLKSLFPGTSFSNVEVSPDDMTYTPTLETTEVYDQWVIASVRIVINGTPGT